MYSITWINFNVFYCIVLCQVDGILNMYNVPAHRGIEIEGGDEAWDTERERGKTVKTTSIGHKKSKHDYCQFFCHHPFPH